MILLFNPRSARWKHRLPLSLLTLGSMLEGKYEYEIVDGNFETNPAETLIGIIREKQIRYLGVTVMPGPQLVEAITVTRQVKAQFPQLVVVWGGYFPSLHAEIVLQSGFVDYVIKGPGEVPFLELIDRLEGKGTRGQTPRPQKRDEGSDPLSPSSPSMPYHRISDMRRYIGKT